MQKTLLILKRDGMKVKYESIKIENAIKKAFEGIKLEYSEEKIKEMVQDIEKDVFNIGTEEVDIETIQDLVQKKLYKYNYIDVAEAYISYRTTRSNIRKKKQDAYQIVANTMKKTSRENANVGNGPSGKLLQIAEGLGGDYSNSYLTPKEIEKVIREKLIYRHDNSWSVTGTTTCTFLPLSKCLKSGFNTGHGYTRPAKRIKTACQHACIILQSNQNDQHGGQAYAFFDRDMKYVVKSEYQYQKMIIINNLVSMGLIDTMLEDTNLEIKNIVSKLQNIELLSDTKYKNLLNQYNKIYTNLKEEYKKSIDILAWKNTRLETFQAMEGLVANFNTMHSRAGAQVPFSSINVGLDTSKEGRLVTEMLLKAYEKGLGNGEQCIFPNIIFQVKEGLSYLGDPNEDLFKLSLKVTTKRLFPNYVFEDCTLNKIFKNGTAVMGCRTALGLDIYNKEQNIEGRGNLSFTSVNLPKIALNNIYKTKNIIITEEESKFNILSQKYDINIPEIYLDNLKVKLFFNDLNDIVNLTIKQLIDRLENIQGNFMKKDFPFLMNGIWQESENLQPTDKVYDVLKHGSLAVGFIGLAETLIALVGKHQGEDNNADLLGEEIVKFMRNKCNEAIELYHYNFGLLATPAEGLTGKLMKDLQQTFGKIEGITDKDYLTNSFHVPVYYECSVFHKIKVEGKYHKYCNGGNISYVEIAESPIGNELSLLPIIKAMKDADMSFVAFNFPIDRCKKCGHIGNIGEECPTCKSIDISRPARITGYLAEEDNFGYAKKMEKRDRVKHIRL